MTTTTPAQHATRTRAWLAAGLVVAGTATDVAIDPSRTHIPLCPFHSISGAWCPLCGGLRAVASLAHGDIPAALHDNILVVAAIPVAITMWLLAILRPQLPIRLDKRAWLGVITLAVVFTVVRNVPAGAFLHP